VSKRVRWAGYVIGMGEKRNACRVLVGKSEGRRPQERPRHRWKDTIKIYLRKTGWVGMDGINLTQDADRWQVVVNTVMNLRVLSNFGKFFSSYW
jgi:hypothetical protein